MLPFSIFTNLELNAKELQEIKGGKRVYSPNLQQSLVSAIATVLQGGTNLQNLGPVKTAVIKGIQIEWRCK